MEELRGRINSEKWGMFFSKINVWIKGKTWGRKVNLGKKEKGDL